MLQHEPSQDNEIGKSTLSIGLFTIDCDRVKRAIGRDPSLHLQSNSPQDSALSTPDRRFRPGAPRIRGSLEFGEMSQWFHLLMEYPDD